METLNFLNFASRSSPSRASEGRMASINFVTFTLKVTGRMETITFITFAAEVRLVELWNGRTATGNFVNFIRG
jgi:hypothetical protein